MALQQRRSRAQQDQEQQYEQQIQTRAAGTAFLNPILAREKQSGELVTVIAFGDIPGHSPSYLCVDDAGASSWLSLIDVQITDPKVLPLTPELMARLQDQQQANQNR